MSFNKLLGMEDGFPTKQEAVRGLFYQMQWVRFDLRFGSTWEKRNAQFRMGILYYLYRAYDMRPEGNGPGQYNSAKDWWAKEAPWTCFKLGRKPPKGDGSWPSSTTGAYANLASVFSLGWGSVPEALPVEQEVPQEDGEVLPEDCPYVVGVNPQHSDQEVDFVKKLIDWGSKARKVK